MSGEMSAHDTAPEERAKYDSAKGTEHPREHPRTMPRAPFPLRIGAFFCDLAIILHIFVATSVVALTTGWISSEPGIDIFEILCFFLYHLIFMWLWSGTPGKRLFGLAVVRGAGATRVGPIYGLIRTIGYVASLLFFGLGYWLALGNKEGRAGHDFLAGTKVVQKEKVKLALPVFLTVLLVADSIAFLFLFRLWLFTASRASA